MNAVANLGLDICVERDLHDFSLWPGPVRHQVEKDLLADLGFTHSGQRSRVDLALVIEVLDGTHQ